MKKRKFYIYTVVIGMLVLAACQKWIGTDSELKLEEKKIVAAKTASGKKTLLPDAAPIIFSLSDHKGDWQTSLSVTDRNGAFKGVYTTDPKKGKVYISKFHGKFSDIRKINSCKYMMVLSELAMEKEIGKEWVEQGTHYVACEPRGLEAGKNFFLYTSETPVKELYEDFSSSELKKWFPCYEVGKKSKEPLSRFALCNQEKKYVFFTNTVIMKDEIDEGMKADKKERKPASKKKELKLPKKVKFFFTQSGGSKGIAISITSRDGKFKGKYDFPDKSSGDSARYSNFSGKFGNIKKLKHGIYSMTLKKLTAGKRVPYGLKKGERFILYTPKTPMKLLEEEFHSDRYLSWLPYYDITKRKYSDKLSTYAFYNKRIGYGISIN